VTQSHHRGNPTELALADWLEELAVYGTPRNSLDPEIAYQLKYCNRELVFSDFGSGPLTREIEP